MLGTLLALMVWGFYLLKSFLCCKIILLNIHLPLLALVWFIS